MDNNKNLFEETKNMKWRINSYYLQQCWGQFKKGRGVLLWHTGSRMTVTAFSADIHSFDMNRQNRWKLLNWKKLYGLELIRCSRDEKKTDKHTQDHNSLFRYRGNKGKYDKWTDMPRICSFKYFPSWQALTGKKLHWEWERERNHTLDSWTRNRRVDIWWMNLCDSKNISKKGITASLGRRMICNKKTPSANAVD